MPPTYSSFFGLLSGLRDIADNDSWTIAPVSEEHPYDTHVGEEG